MSTDPRSVHFLGICGTAMGAVAVAMGERGTRVTGQDENVYPPMSDYLESKGIRITQGFDPKEIPADTDLIVIGNALSRGNPAVEAILNRRFPYASLPETIKNYFLRGKHNLVVAGTHGKTTTTSLLAWIFESAGLAPGWLIGGIPANLPTSANFMDAKYFIIEGDEYDTAFFDKRSKFLHYLPELAIVNNIEFDHADIYRDIDEIKTSFQRFLNLVPSEGMVLVNADDPQAVDVAKTCPAPVLEVGFSPNAGNQIRNSTQGPHGSSFSLFDTTFHLPLLGEFNIRNAAMAASAAHFYGVPAQEIQKAFTAFRGIKRRQEILGIVGGITVIDDFGHHPTAIRETLTGLRARYNGSKIWALFEPRSNTTRRKIFQQDLPIAFDKADGVFIARVARLEQVPPEERLDPEQVVRDIATTGRPAFYEPSPEAIVNRLLPLLEEGDVVVVFSNGGFGGIHEKILQGLAEQGSGPGARSD